MFEDEEELYAKEKLNALKQKYGLEEKTISETPRITLYKLKEICTLMKLYTSLELNDKMYLQRQGFRKIENLDSLTGIRALWLEGNAISVIENLEPCKQLRCLFAFFTFLSLCTSYCRYLNENFIEKIEGLKKLVELDTLDLHHNLISKIENLQYNVKLHTLNLAQNEFLFLFYFFFKKQFQLSGLKVSGSAKGC